MLGVSDAFKAFLFNQQVREPLIRVLFENTSDDPDHGLESFDLEFTEFVRNFGQVSRELSLEHGVFRAGTNSLQIKNTDDFGDYFFSLRKRFGDAIWNDKTYHLAWGFKQFPVATAVAGILPKFSTLGFGTDPAYAVLCSTPATLGLGDTASGDPSVDTVTEEIVNLYTGDIQRTTYDRVGCAVHISSRDFYQRLVDFKICKKVLAEDIFTASDGTVDNRAIQKTLKYGTHKLITRTTGQNGAISDRNNPFSASICVPNLYLGTSLSGVGTYNPYHFWYLPVTNGISRAEYVTGTLKLWYWDYIGRTWKAFPVAEFSTGRITAETPSGGVSGLIFQMNSPGITTVDGDTWTEYVNGTGTYYVKNTDSTNIDPAICADTLSSLTDSNPVRIIHDLLTSTKFMYINQYLTDILDYYSMTSPDDEYAFDSAFSFYDTEVIKINVSQEKETTVAKLIESICGLVGMKFYVTANKSPSERRCIKLKVDKVHNPCEALPNLLTFSTRDRLSGYETTMSKDDYYDRVQAMAFDSSYSTRENYDLITKGTGNKSILLGGKDVYYYNCTAAAQGIVDRLYNKFIKPTEEIVLDTDAAAMIVENGDFIKCHDHRLDEEIVAEVYRHTFDLRNKVKISARRYTKLFGPDELRPYKVYAFCGCARAGTNQEGGSGADASISSGGTTVTFVGAIDLGLVKAGMALRIEGTMFWINSITDSTHVEVDTAATATLSNKDWSIGKSYHVR